MCMCVCGTGNYLLIIAVLAVYALISNWLLVFALAFLVGGFAAINKFGAYALLCKGGNPIPLLLLTYWWILFFIFNYLCVTLQMLCNGGCLPFGHLTIFRAHYHRPII
jgi:hypothetical protein